MPRSYESDHTKFIRELKQKNPQIEEGQIEGRAILWDKQIDRESQRRYRDSRVPQQGYVYQNYVGGPPPKSTGSGEK
jgi:hypothetical protein